MSRGTKAERIVARLLGALREDEETEHAMISWIARRYPERLFELVAPRLSAPDPPAKSATPKEGGP